MKLLNILNALDFGHCEHANRGAAASNNVLERFVRCFGHSNDLVVLVGISLQAIIDNYSSSELIIL